MGKTCVNFTFGQMANCLKKTVMGQSTMSWSTCLGCRKPGLNPQHLMIYFRYRAGNSPQESSSGASKPKVNKEENEDSAGAIVQQVKGLPCK